MIEFIKGSVSEISDWSGIWVFYAIELTRQRAFVILSDPSDGATPIESKISELSPPKNNDEMEMLEVLYGQLHIEEVLRSLDPNLLNAD